MQLSWRIGRQGSVEPKLSQKESKVLVVKAIKIGHGALSDYRVSPEVQFSSCHCFVSIPELGLLCPLLTPLLPQTTCLAPPGHRAGSQ